MFLQTTLLFKTVLILSSQLAIVLVTSFALLKGARKAYENNTSYFGMWFRGSVNMKNQLNLIPYQKPPTHFPAEMSKDIKNKEGKNATESKIAMSAEHRLDLMREGYKDTWSASGAHWSIFGVWMTSLFGCVIFASYQINIYVGMALFTFTNFLFGPLLGLMLLNMDENDGYRALKIVLMVTLATGFIGFSDIYSFSESSFLAISLFISLLGLVIFEFIRIFRDFSRNTIRMKAIFGAFLFSVFLLFDFNLLSKKAEMGINDWYTAFQMAFTIYLDIINLLLEILEAMD